MTENSITIEKLNEVAEEFKQRFPGAGVNNILVSIRGEAEVNRMVASMTSQAPLMVRSLLGLRIEVRSWFPDYEFALISDSCLELLDEIARIMGSDEAAIAWKVLSDLSQVQERWENDG